MIAYSPGSGSKRAQATATNAAKAAMQPIRIKGASCLRSRSASAARTIAGAGAVSTA